MKQRWRRLEALILSLAMVLTLILEPSGVRFVNAEGTQHSIDFTAISEEGVTDKEPIPEGTTYDNGYFKIVGKVTMRTSGNGTLKCVEVDKNGNGAIQFTTAAPATVSFLASSTGSSNVSAVGLVDAAGTPVSEDQGITEVTGTGKVTLTYSDLPAGTYRVVSPESSYNRGARIYQVTAEEQETAVTTSYYLDVTTISSEGVTDKDPIPEGTTYVDGYYKIVGTVTQRISSSTGATTSVEVGKALSGAIQFTVAGTADAVIEMSSTGGSNTSPAGLLNVSTGEMVSEQSGTTLVTGTSRTRLVYTGLNAGVYQIVSPENGEYNRGARVYTVQVDETVGGTRPDRADWDTVAAPVITSVVSQNGAIQVAYTGLIGYDGADRITVQLLLADGSLAAEQSVASDGTEGTVTFTPGASGTYTVRAIASREGEADKVSESASVDFVLPLGTPVITSGTSMGGGAVLITWDAVQEADSYIVAYKEAGAASYTETEPVTETQATVTGLEVGKTYSFTVTAVRGIERSAASAVKDVTITADTQMIWSFKSFGTNTTDDTRYNGYSGDLNADGSVTVWNTDTKGKLVPNSTDGLSFYYTAIPSDQNFTLRADVAIDSWTLTNGQEGFGIMAADAIGTTGLSFWNNSYMASVTKVEYAGNQGGNITMKLGIGAQEKTGVPVGGFDPADGTPDDFQQTMKPLETSCIDMPAGTYNIVGNYTNTIDLGDRNLRTTFTLEIRRNNTGYYLTYYDTETGEVIGQQMYYDLERDNLNAVDPDSIYVGFFAARSCTATFSNVSVESHDPSLDPPAEEHEIEYVTPSYKIISTSHTGNAAHTLTFYGNADGVLTITDADGNAVVDAAVYSVGTYYNQAVALAEGENVFTVTFTPDPDFRPDGSEYKRLSSYETAVFTHTVVYQILAEGTVSLYVSPEGTPNGAGTKESPLDINTAVKYVQPGQTIVLAGGTYNLTSPVVIARGISGTADAMIYMTADPDAEERPVFDFGGVSEGLTAAGDYWYIKGIDVTHTSNGNRGILVAGKHCTFDQINTYENGNTGLQISRYLSTDERELWPSDNLILNCTSYANADAGYEDADGFAAKLTCGEGNVFDGCISYNNADDGWDLYAKVETGSIGAVTIRNSVAYGNGYLPDGTDAGNGNGFKMGGESLTAGHHLINCIAYNNKAKGIDSNSCPDIIIENSTSYNNESYNVALYTNVAKNTNFLANGIISFRVGTDVNEQIKPVGTQDLTRIYKESNYFWNNGSSQNTLGETVTEDWFVSLDTSIKPDRDADGTIQMHGLLELTEAAPASSGARLTGHGTPSGTVPIPDYPSLSDQPGADTGETGSAVPALWLGMLLAFSGAAVVYSSRRKRERE